jgi:hypothetical protein
MIDRAAVVAIYLQAFWPVIAFCMGYALAAKSEALARATILTAMGQFFIMAWDAAFPGVGSPWPGYCAMFAITAYCATVIPAGRFLAVFAGVNIAGLCFSIIGVAIAKGKPSVDDNLWLAILFISCLEIIILVAFTGGGIGGVSRDLGRRLLAGLAIKARRRGVAR